MDIGRESQTVVGVNLEAEVPKASYETTKCLCSFSDTGRNLVVCIDGTSNQFSEANSNVVELYSRLVKDKHQLTYYNSGIGTYVKDSNSWFPFRRWRQNIVHGIDMAVATTFKEKVCGAYQWLSENYEVGDRIFLFGFSRGAYQVRVVAGMIEQVGLLHKGNNEQIPFAYELYAESISNQKRSDQRKPAGLVTHFKKTLSRPNVKVHFVGTWDTVSSLGAFGGPSLPETTSGMKHVCVFRHALALDELRVKFLPEYANGGAGPQVDDGNASRPRIKEVWFSGTHSDMQVCKLRLSGGNVTNVDNTRFGPALRWMSYEAIKSGLEMVPHQGEWTRIALYQSMTWFWKFLEYIPMPRLSYRDADSMESWPPHNMHPRLIQRGQKIHESVLQELELGNIPQARMYDDKVAWTAAALKEAKLIEEDPYDRADLSLCRIENLDAGDLSVLKTLASHGKFSTYIPSVGRSHPVQKPVVVPSSRYARLGTSSLRPFVKNATCCPMHSRSLLLPKY
ncbi:hypothetical protein GGX14DRAFT_367632 [Mycena pura]|uniref:T6SS Phospholipase effector Tle1-like catalytic domain-containing protein n=1 Tax=Mycena pura TaxID=153505 RepID=A0AAD6YAP3_9AGAR|nr:hypothetical protein GGX14DRAFT_367632 [Mycena pura]